MSLVGLSDAANVTVFSYDASEFQVCDTRSDDSQPKECAFAASGDTVYVRVDGQSILGTSAAYTALLIVRPSVTSVVSEGTRDAPVAIADAIPRLGQVSTRGTSFYVATGLAADEPHVVAITALTGAADLHVYPDSTYALELECTLNNVSSVIGIAQDCTVSGRDTLYFSVTSGALNREGAAYEVLVE